MLIDGYSIAEKINKKTKSKLIKLKKKGYIPHIVAFLVGHNSASEVYLRQKEKLAKKLGFGFELINFSSKISEKELISTILQVQNQKETAGIIIQLPLPIKFNTYRILSSISLDVDIDCLSDVGLGQLVLSNNIIEPPTAGAVMDILKTQNSSLSGKNIVVIGAGLLVGKPLVMILMNAGATVTVCNKETLNLTKICREADIIITGAGKKNLLRASMVKRGAIVVDAGFSFENGKAYGDSDVAALHKKGVKVTPTPGGVGPITVSKLMYNAAVCAENKKFKK